MKLRIFPALLSLFLLLSSSAAFATDANSPSSDSSEPAPEPLVLDSNLAVCEHIKTYYYKEGFSCDGVKNSEQYILPSGLSLRAPYDRPLVIKNINVKISGYNTGLELHSYPVEISDSTISSTHGCLAYLGGNRSSVLTIVSGVFSTEKSYRTAYSTEPEFTNIPSPFCSLDTEPSAATANLNSILAENSSFYLSDAETLLLPEENLADGISGAGKVGPYEVKYLASSTIVVKNTPETPEDPEPKDPEPEQPTPKDPEPTPEETVIIPKTPNTGRK